MQRSFLGVMGILGLSLVACLQSPEPDNKFLERTAGDVFPPGTYDSSKLINWHVRPGNAWVLNNADGEVYLYVHVRSGQSPNAAKRMPLNVSLVLDRSGSMSGAKIEYARKAATFLVDQLSPDDYLSIVNYDDAVEITSPAQQVRNKEALKAAIGRITDRGSTNLSGGMLEGYTQVKSMKKEGYVNRVLLLTDGLANAGITEPSALKKIVEKKYQEEGLALSTFGLGADYNEDLLTLLAETGRANYYFIDSADKIPGLFARELKGLLSVVAQNAMVEINLPKGMQCEKVYGYPFEVRDGKVQVRFNDIYSNDEKIILVKLSSGKQLAANLEFDCTLKYTDAEKFEPVSLSTKTRVTSTTDKTLVEKGYDPVVQEMLALFQSSEQFDEIMSQVDKGEYDKAKQSGRVAIEDLKKKNQQYPSKKLEEQYKKMNAYVQAVDSVSTMRESDKKLYQKSNKSVNYEVKKQKKQN